MIVYNWEWEQWEDEDDYGCEGRCVPMTPEGEDEWEFEQEFASWENFYEWYNSEEM